MAADTLQAKRLVEHWIQQAKLMPSLPQGNDFPKERRLLEQLIPVKAAGFRGVVLTAIVGKALNPSYNPTNDFYACNPRSIFEKGIYYALVEHGVPCGKSDPLNVAKNARVIDATWAQGRRPESAAMAAVGYIDLLHTNWHDEPYRKQLILLFFSRLLEYAEFCQSKNVPLGEFAGATPIQLAIRLADFVESCPEGGATPQVVVGTLINQLRLDDPDFATVEGAAESVFGTNTTSKKPADIWEVRANGSLGMLYEITAKPVDTKRIDDCVGSLEALGLTGGMVTFICRLPQDTAGLRTENQTLIHLGTAFQFLDMRSFILQIFCALKPEQQERVIHVTDAFVKETNRKIETKVGWASLFG